MPDVIEGLVDSDGDGQPDYLDLDSDGDGIGDEEEAREPGAENGGTVYTDTDLDGIPDRLDHDTDNDGLPDREEGLCCWRISNRTVTVTQANPDLDGDGIPDATEGTGDADGDGVPNFLDLDSDGDGIPDEVEGTGDLDGDGVPNFLDQDSDGDGISDSIEGFADEDGDGMPNYLDLDSDGDGLSDELEAVPDYGRRILSDRPIDTDGDGKPDFLDLDSDSDGLTDELEGNGDDDEDSVTNFRDPWQNSENGRRVDDDTDGDGIPDADEGTGDADGDGISNYLDLDSDGDGIPDEEEGTADSDGDGVPNFLDKDVDILPPVACRAPGCRNLENDEELDNLQVRRNIAALPLAADEGVFLGFLLLLLPLFFVCFHFFCRGLLAGHTLRARCPHCKLRSRHCKAGGFKINISRECTEKHTAEERELMRQTACLEIAGALSISPMQVSVGPIPRSGRHVAIQFIDRLTMEFLENRLGEDLVFRRTGSEALQLKTSKRPNRTLEREKLVEEFRRQARDENSPLRSGDVLRWITVVQFHKSAYQPCMKCGLSMDVCTCKCDCCAEKLKGCAAQCLPRCVHCTLLQVSCKAPSAVVILEMEGPAEAIARLDAAHGPENLFDDQLPQDLCSAAKHHLAETLHVNSQQVTVSLSHRPDEMGVKTKSSRTRVQVFLATSAASLNIQTRRTRSIVDPSSTSWSDFKRADDWNFMHDIVPILIESAEMIVFDAGGYQFKVVSAEPKDFLSPEPRCLLCQAPQRSCICECNKCGVGLRGCQLLCTPFGCSSEEYSRTSRSQSSESTVLPSVMPPGVFRDNEDLKALRTLGPADTAVQGDLVLTTEIVYMSQNTAREAELAAPGAGSRGDPEPDAGSAAQTYSGQTRIKRFSWSRSDKTSTVPRIEARADRAGAPDEADTAVEQLAAPSPAALVTTNSIGRSRPGGFPFAVHHDDQECKKKPEGKRETIGNAGSADFLESDADGDLPHNWRRPRNDTDWSAKAGESERLAMKQLGFAMVLPSGDDISEGRGINERAGFTEPAALAVFGVRKYSEVWGSSGEAVTKAKHRLSAGGSGAEDVREAAKHLQEAERYRSLDMDARVASTGAAEGAAASGDSNTEGGTQNAPGTVTDSAGKVRGSGTRLDVLAERLKALQSNLSGQPSPTSPLRPSEILHEVTADDLSKVSDSQDMQKHERALRELQACREEVQQLVEKHLASQGSAAGLLQQQNGEGTPAVLAAGNAGSADFLESDADGDLPHNWRRPRNDTDWSAKAGESERLAMKQLGFAMVLPSGDDISEGRGINERAGFTEPAALAVFGVRKYSEVWGSSGEAVTKAKHRLSAGGSGAEDVREAAKHLQEAERYRSLDMDARVASTGACRGTCQPAGTCRSCTSQMRHQRALEALKACRVELERKMHTSSASSTSSASRVAPVEGSFRRSLPRILPPVSVQKPWGPGQDPSDARDLKEECSVTIAPIPAPVTGLPKHVM